MRRILLAALLITGVATGAQAQSWDEPCSMVLRKLADDFTHDAEIAKIRHIYTVMANDKGEHTDGFCTYGKAIPADEMGDFPFAEMDTIIGTCGTGLHITLRQAMFMLGGSFRFGCAAH